MYEAIGLLELDSIAAGIEVADVMVKAAPVDFVDAFMVTPGKYIVVVHGDPTSVRVSPPGVTLPARRSSTRW